MCGPPRHLNSAPGYSFSLLCASPGAPHPTASPSAGDVGSERGVCSLSTYHLVKEFGTLSGLSEVLSKGPQVIRRWQVIQHIPEYGKELGNEWQRAPRGAARL